MIYINFGYVIVGRLFLNHIWDISINQIFNVGYIYISQQFPAYQIFFAEWDTRLRQLDGFFKSELNLHG